LNFNIFRMKKTIVIVLLLGIFIACNSGDKTGGTKADAAADGTTPAAAAATNPEADKGLELIGKSDCFTCHKVVDASTGPAYEAVAAKYPDNEAVVDSLSKKIIKGGSGNWGAIPMTPHPEISEADAKSMVRYVLSLK
jgi:cytochrome c